CQRTPLWAPHEQVPAADVRRFEGQSDRICGRSWWERATSARSGVGTLECAHVVGSGGLLSVLGVVVRVDGSLAAALDLRLRLRAADPVGALDGLAGLEV